MFALTQQKKLSASANLVNVIKHNANVVVLWGKMNTNDISRPYGLAQHLLQTYPATPAPGSLVVALRVWMAEKISSNDTMIQCATLLQNVIAEHAKMLGIKDSAGNDVPMIGKCREALSTPCVKRPNKFCKPNNCMTFASDGAPIANGRTPDDLPSAQRSWTLDFRQFAKDNNLKAPVASDHGKSGVPLSIRALVSSA